MKGEGHLTRINDILTNLMQAERLMEAERKDGEVMVSHVPKSGHGAPKSVVNQLPQDLGHPPDGEREVDATPP